MSAQPSDFQQAVMERFLQVMRAKRPDLMWSGCEPNESRELVPDPADIDTFPHRPTRAIDGG